MSPSFREAAAALRLQSKTLLVRSTPHHLRVVQMATFPVQAAQIAAVVDASNTVLLSCQFNASVSLCKQQTVSVQHGNSRAQKRIRQHRGPLADTWRRLAVARTWHSTPLIAHAQTDSRSWSIQRRCGQWRLRTGSCWQVWRNGGMPVPREHVRSRAWRLDRASI